MYAVYTWAYVVVLIVFFLGGKEINSETKPPLLDSLESIYNRH